METRLQNFNAFGGNFLQGAFHKQRWGISQTTLTSFKLFFHHYVDIFYLINADKKSTFLDYLPTSSGYVVCERPLVSRRGVGRGVTKKYNLVKSMYII